MERACNQNKFRFIGNHFSPNIAGANTLKLLVSCSMEHFPIQKSKHWHLKSERLSELMQKRLELLIVVTIKSIKDWVDFVSHKIYSERNFIYFTALI